MLDCSESQTVVLWKKAGGVQTLMESIRESKIEEHDEREDITQRVLLEIAKDARNLKDRYLSETIVPEGGE